MYSVPSSNHGLTLLPTEFYDFRSYGLSHTAENNIKITWLIWNLVHCIRLLTTQDFRRFAVLFLEILRHEFRLKGTIDSIPMFTTGIRI